MTFLACAIIQFEGTVQLQVVIGITKAAIAVAVPKQTVVLIRQHEGDRNLGVILEEILVLALHIELLALMLTKSIESLIVWTIELHLPRETMLSLLRNREPILDAIFTLRHREVPELLTVLRFLQQLLTCCIKESHFTSSF